MIQFIPLRAVTIAAFVPLFLAGSARSQVFLKGPQQEDKPLPPAVQAEIVKKLGDAQEGKFVFMFSKQMAAQIYERNKIPQNARVLPGNRWLEVIYFADMVDGRDAAIKLLGQFYWHTQQNPGNQAKFDWRYVGRFDDPQQAEAEFAKAFQMCAQNSVTHRPKTAEGLRFFGFGKPNFKGFAP